MHDKDQSPIHKCRVGLDACFDATTRLLRNVWYQQGDRTTEIAVYRTNQPVSSRYLQTPNRRLSKKPTTTPICMRFLHHHSTSLDKKYGVPRVEDDSREHYAPCQLVFGPIIPERRWFGLPNEEEWEQREKESQYNAL